MQTRSRDENSVCLPVRPSIRPSVCQTREWWLNWRKISADFYYVLMYENWTQNYDPEIREEYLIHDTPIPLQHHL